MENNIFREMSCLIIFNKDWKILMQDRKWISKKWEAWAFFWGGIDEWETKEEWLIREIKEELDLDLKIKEVDFIESFYIKRVWEEDKILKFNYFWLITNKQEKDFTVLEWAGCKYMSPEDCLNHQLFWREWQKEIIYSIHEKMKIYFNNKIWK